MQTAAWRRPGDLWKEVTVLEMTEDCVRLHNPEALQGKEFCLQAAW